MSNIYNEKVIKIFSDPKNVGVIDSPSGQGTVGNESCGDIMSITIKVVDNVIVDAKFQTYGCAAAIASSSTATEMIIGKTIEQALKIKNSQVIEQLEGLPPQKIHCSVLAEQAIKLAIDDYISKQNK